MENNFGKVGYLDLVQMQPQMKWVNEVNRLLG